MARMLQVDSRSFILKDESRCGPLEAGLIEGTNWLASFTTLLGLILQQYLFSSMFTFLIKTLMF